MDVVAAINEYARTKRLAIVRAGGEATVRGEAGVRLFPDVLLFGDPAAERVRQGWELKFPDTPIQDPALLSNAAAKARLLGVNSFLVWNVNEAALHTERADDNSFVPLHTWPPLGITRREEVLRSDDRWRSRLAEILDTLNEYFRSGQLSSASPVEVLRDRFLADFLETLVPGAADALREAAASSARLDRRFRRWWTENAAEYGARGSDPVSLPDLALVVLTSWTNRFLFCHYLKHFHQVAALVDGIRDDCAMEEAEDVFGTVSAECDFMQVFGAHPFSEHIGEDSWRALVRFNEFLGELRLRELPHDQFGSVLERMLVYSRRKAAGQFVTPPGLARLLVELTMERRREAVLDPCCGTGQIALAAYEGKRRAGIGVAEAMATVWASDKFHFPLQLCTLALAHRESTGETLRVFRRDVFDLAPGQPVALVEPDGGRKVVVDLERPVTVVSNLPFVRAEDFDAVNERARAARGERRIGNRADLFARVLLHLADLVAENGRIGVIVGNSWLGTEWGMALRRELRERFHIETVVMSGAGRWFAEPEVVTTILVLTRTGSSEAPSRFVTTLKPVGEWTEAFAARLADDLDRSETVEAPDYVIRPQPQALVRVVEDALRGCTSLFGECGWLPEALNRLAPIERFFTVRRGERRGWNPMFYPAGGHGIESEYLAPVLRSSVAVRGLRAIPDGVAFCCSRTVEELGRLGHAGARRWIRRFERARNRKGRSLPEVLARAGHHWYEMKAERQADFVMSVNPDERLFVARMTDRSFVDQRLIALTARTPELDCDLMHALMNTTLGKFLIEAAGFGRGLSALDLSRDRMAAVFRIPDPARIVPDARDRIVAAFRPLLARGILSVPEELSSADSRRLDEAVFRAVGLSPFEDAIRESLLALYRIRRAVKEHP